MVFSDFLELTPKEKEEFVVMVVLARKMELMKREQISLRDT